MCEGGEGRGGGGRGGIGPWQLECLETESRYVPIMTAHPAYSLSRASLLSFFFLTFFSLFFFFFFSSPFFVLLKRGGRYTGEEMLGGISTKGGLETLFC